MDWYKAKTILIAFLVVVNISLFTYLIMDSRSSDNTDNKVLDITVSLLDENGIAVERTLFKELQTPDYVENIYVENLIGDYAEFAGCILGDDVKVDGGQTYSSELGKVRFEGDYFYADACEGKVFEKISVLTKNSAESVAKKYLSSIGIDIDKRTYVTSVADDLSNVTFNLVINDIPVFDAYISVKLSKDGIVSVSGAAFCEQSKNAPDIELKSISGILIDYMNRKANAKKPHTISDISFGYALSESEQYHEGFELTPVWRITDSNGFKENIDARNSE